jgi:hypothetical protein
VLVIIVEEMAGNEHRGTDLKRGTAECQRSPRPNVQRHRERIQDFLLDGYRSEGSLKGSILSRQALRDRDPARYEWIVGSPRVVPDRTLRGHWERIDRVRRDAAKHDAAREREGAS